MRRIAIGLIVLSLASTAHGKDLWSSGIEKKLIDKVDKKAPEAKADLNMTGNDIINTKNVVLIGGDGSRTFNVTNTIAPTCNTSKEGRMYYHYDQQNHPTGSGWKICRNGNWEDAP